MVTLRFNSHLDLGAGCGRPAFLICVEVFREQAADEITKETSRGEITFIVFFLFFCQIQHK